MSDLKKHKSLQEQVETLLSRGLVIEDIADAKNLLFRVNYYRFSGYLFNFQDKATDMFEAGTSLSQIEHIYDFDRRFSKILMFALEDIEETFKTRLSYTLTSHYTDDPIIYLKPQIYRNYTQYLRFLAHFYKEVENNKNTPFVKHHKKNYGGFLPMWVAVELFTMGNLQAVYDNLQAKYQKELAKIYNTGPKQLSSWIENLTYTRNHIAHYMRIFRFNFGHSPLKCKNHAANFQPTQMIFDQLYIISCLYSDASEWNNYVIPEISATLDEYSSCVKLADLGFPLDWEKILRRT